MSTERVPDVLTLYLQAVQAIEQQASTTRELMGTIHQGFQTLQEDHRGIISQLTALTAAIQAQTAAQDARTMVFKELGTGLLVWMQQRWVSLLLGLATGLGLAGGRELLGALLGNVLQGSP